MNVINEYSQILGKKLSYDERNACSECILVKVRPRL